MMLTTERILALGPCVGWTAERIDKLLEPHGGSIDALRALDCRTLWGEDGPSLIDRVWLGIQLLPDDRSRRLMACRWARRALRRERRAGREPDARSWRAVQVAEQYARGEASRKDLRRACADADAAYAAACAAYAHAAYAADAAVHAAYAHAAYAAYAAADAAVYAAADAAAYDAPAADAARDAAYRGHLAELRAALREGS